MDSDFKKPLSYAVIALVAVFFLWKLFFSGPNISADLESGSTEARLRAVEELERLDSASAAELISKYANDPDLVVARRVIISMGRMKNQVKTEQLLPLLESPKYEIREAAIIAVGVRGIKGNPEALRKVMVSDPIPSVRAAAVSELAAMRDWEAMKSFAALLSDSDLMVQNTAAEAIMRIGGIMHQGFRTNASAADRQTGIRFLQHFWQNFKPNHDEFQRYLQIKGNSQ
ncbi:MAG: HEAT repeat domain-containing protein [Phycisphaeraceae bacterium]